MSHDFNGAIRRHCTSLVTLLPPLQEFSNYLKHFDLNLSSIKVWLIQFRPGPIAPSKLQPHFWKSQILRVDLLGLEKFRQHSRHRLPDAHVGVPLLRASFISNSVR